MDFTETVLVSSDFQILYTRIMAVFPTEPVDLLGSFARNLLTELSTLFYAFPSSAFTMQGSQLVSQYKHYISDVWDLLSTLLTTDFTALTSNRTHCKSRKTKNRNITPRINEALFNNLDIGIPSSASEAAKTSAGILRTLNQALRVHSIAILVCYWLLIDHLLVLPGSVIRACASKSTGRSVLQLGPSWH